MRSSRRPSGRPVSFSAAYLLGGAVVAFGGVARRVRERTPRRSWRSRLLFSVLAGVLVGPLAGMLVALAGGVGFVVFVTNGQLGGWVAVVLWIVAAGIAGAVFGLARSWIRSGRRPRVGTPRSSRRRSDHASRAPARTHGPARGRRPVATCAARSSTCRSDRSARQAGRPAVDGRHSPRDRGGAWLPGRGPRAMVELPRRPKDIIGDAIGQLRS